jgi:hypothetical protein
VFHIITTPITIADKLQASYIFDLSPFTGPIELDLVDTPVYITPLNEGLLNEMLAYVTIGALSLNLWHGMANGSISRTHTIYRFDRRLNLCLPYVDNGFVQILITAATGNTSVEQAARSGCFGGTGNISEELKRLKV